MYSYDVVCCFTFFKADFVVGTNYQIREEHTFLLHLCLYINNIQETFLSKCD